MGRGNESFVWQYFERSSDKTSARCGFCLKWIKMSGGTGNLHTHLKKIHPEARADNVEENTPKMKLAMASASAGSGDEAAEASESILSERSRKKRRITKEMKSTPKITSVTSNGYIPVIPEKKLDEFDVFGQMVASQIRKFSRRNQAVAKNTIQNFLFDMEMREMDETPAPVQETVLQSLDPSSPPQIAKHANTGVYADYAAACKKIEDLAMLNKA